jgi:hypothetical protein
VQPCRSARAEGVEPGARGSPSPAGPRLGGRAGTGRTGPVLAEFTGGCPLALVLQLQLVDLSWDEGSGPVTCSISFQWSACIATRQAVPCPVPVRSVCCLLAVVEEPLCCNRTCLESAHGVINMLVRLMCLGVLCVRCAVYACRAVKPIAVKTLSRPHM